MIIAGRVPSVEQFLSPLQYNWQQLLQILHIHTYKRRTNSRRLAKLYKKLLPLQADKAIKIKIKKQQQDVLQQTAPHYGARRYRCCRHAYLVPQESKSDYTHKL